MPSSFWRSSGHRDDREVSCGFCGKGVPTKTRLPFMQLSPKPASKVLDPPTTCILTSGRSGVPRPPRRHTSAFCGERIQGGKAWLRPEGKCAWRMLRVPSCTTKEVLCCPRRGTTQVTAPAPGSRSLHVPTPGMPKASDTTPTLWTISIHSFPGHRRGVQGVPTRFRDTDPKRALSIPRTLSLSVSVSLHLSVSVPLHISVSLYPSPPSRRTHMNQARKTSELQLQSTSWTPCTKTDVCAPPTVYTGVRLPP